LVRERIAFDTIGGLLRCHVGVHRGRWRAGVLELRIRPQETKTKNQPPGVAGILTTGGTICERTVESRLLLPRLRWDQDRRVLLICCFKPTGNSSVGQGGIEELENVLIFGALQISALCLRFYPIHLPPKHNPIALLCRSQKFSPIYRLAKIFLFESVDQKFSTPIP
jgi:hypothetical protein